MDDLTARLWDKAEDHYRALRAEAVESQRRSDLTLYSQFNMGLLFTGLAGAVRCDGHGTPDAGGGYFKGIEWRAIGSVEEQINSITVFPTEDGGLDVHFGSRVDDRPQGVWVFTGDSHSLLQLVTLSTKVLPRAGFESEVRDADGRVLEFDPKAIRKAAMGDGERIHYGDELRLFCSARAESVEDALEAADTLSRRFYERFGLETECYKIGKEYGNFFIMREENFNRFIPNTPSEERAVVLLTATLVCRRCRRELNEFRDLARHYPHVKAAVVNLSSPQFSFYERVFGDMGGGDPDEFRKNAAGVTPFLIIYAADDHGVLKFAEYVATGKAELTPSIAEAMPGLEKYFVDPVKSPARAASV